MECKQGCTCVTCNKKKFKNNIPEHYFADPAMFKPMNEWKEVGIWGHGKEYETFYMDPDCNNTEGIPVVIKEIWIGWVDMSSTGRRDILSQLKEIMDLPYSPYHLPLLKILPLRDQYFLVFPKTKNRISLMEKVRDGKYFSYEDRLKIAKQVLKGLIHYEKNGYENRDICSMNVELDANNNVKLTNPHIYFHDGRTPNSASPTYSQLVRKIQDKYIYLPSEALSAYPKFKYYAPFAYSTILFELATRTEPYTGLRRQRDFTTTKLIRYVKETGGKVDFPENCEFDLFNDIIMLCRDKDPKLRPVLVGIQDMINQIDIPLHLQYGADNNNNNHRTIDEATEMYTKEFDALNQNQGHFLYQISNCMPRGHLRDILIKQRMDKKNDGKKLMALVGEVYNLY